MLYLSLLFGFLAWALAAAAILVRQRRMSASLLAGSFLSCCISALYPLFIIQYEANKGDFSAVEDTVGGLIFGVVVMMSVTLILAFFALKKLSR